MNKKRENKAFAMGIFILTFLVLGAVSSSLIYVSSLNDFSSKSANSKISGRFLANTIADYVYAKVQSDPKYIENITNPATCNNLITTNPGLNCNFTFSGSNAYVKINKGIDTTKFTGIDKVNLESTLTQYDSMSNESVFEICSPTDKNECASYYAKKTTNTISANYSNRVYSVKLFIKVKSGCGNIKTCRSTTYSSIIKPNQFFDFMYYIKYATLDPIFYTNAYPAYPDATLAGNCGNRYLSARDGKSARDSNCVTVALTSLDKFDNGADFYTSDDYLILCGYPASIGQIFSSDPTRYRGTSIKSATDTACPTLTQSNTNNGTVDLDLTLYGSAYEGAKNLTSTNIISPNSYLTINGGSFSAGSSCSGVGTPLSDGVIIIANGDINICSINAVNKRVSIVAKGNINVQGDITNDGSGSSVVSLIADGNIKIDQIVATQCAEVLTRKIQAFMVSINSSIFTNNWWVDAYTSVNERADCLLVPGKVTATLEITGSIVGKYQPIFGTYNGASATPELLSGYVKNFTFDKRVKKGEITIPYIIPPKTQQWSKLALTEIASTN